MLTPSFSLSALPEWNACLNGASALFLVAGYLFIRRRRILPHKTCMLLAFSCSAAFLVSYVYFHFHAGMVRFAGRGWIRPLYFTLLTTHTVLAAAIVPLAVVTLTFALRGKFSGHKRIAHWTLPIWLYVSITGVVIYWLLFRAYAPWSFLDPATTARCLLLPV